MKCPKCSYLGFETGDRCKNCGYDFSLLAEGHGAAAAPDLPLHDRDPFGPGPTHWLDQLDRGLAGPMTLPVTPPDPLAPLPLDTIAVAPVAATASVAAAAPPARRAEARMTPHALAPALPLFSPGGEADDEPLIKLPAAPRAPLAVRRTPDKPRLRAVPKTARQGVDGAAARQLPVEAEPVLEFTGDPAADAPLHRAVVPPAGRYAPAEACGARRRLVAGAVDHTILSSIDLAVIYLTLKMAALSAGEWTALPVLPLVAFLVMVKVAYFCAFTIVGGQTVGKMAARIRVVGEDGRTVDPPCAIRRTLAGALSLVALGLGFLPVFLGGDRRALHDRVARTRVVAHL